MKVIKNYVEAHTTVSYECHVCKSRYPHRKTAERCSKRVNELKDVKVGDQVVSIMQFVCNHRPRKRDKGFSVHGVIEKIGPLRPADVDYERRWLGGIPARLDAHVREHLF